MMKRYLLLLCGMVGTVSALELSDATQTSDGTLMAPDANRLTVALTLDADVLRDLLALGMPTSWGHNIVTYSPNGSVITGVTLNGSSSSGTITHSGLYARWGTDTAWGPNSSSSSDVRWDGGTDLALLDWEEVAYAGLTYTHYGASGASYSTVCFTLLDAEGGSLLESYVQASGLGTVSALDSAASLTFGSEVQGVYYFNTADLSEETLRYLAVKAAMAPPLPEASSVLFGGLCLGLLCMV